MDVGENKMASSNPIQVSPPANFDIHAPEVAIRWEDWKLEFELYAHIIQLSTQPPVVQRGTFLHALGLIGHKTYKTFVFESTESPDDIQTIIKKFDDRFAADKSEILETYKFRKCIQKQDETFDEWVVELRLKAVSCNFEMALERNTRDQIVFGIYDEATRQEMLKKKNPTLMDIINIGRRAQQAQSFRQTFVQDQKTEIFSFDRRTKNNKAENHLKIRQPEKTTIDSCTYCGYSHTKGRCPAYMKKCNKCNKIGHFAKVCKQSKYKCKEINVNDSEDEFEISALKVTSHNIDSFQSQSVHKPWLHDIETNTGKLRVKLDTGADCDVIALGVAKHHRYLVIKKDLHTILEGFGGEKLKPIGYTIIQGPKHRLKFLVVAENVATILGRESCDRLGLIKRVTHLSVKDSRISTILQDYKDCFEGLGNFGPPHKLQLIHGSMPKIRNAKQIPIALYPKVKEKLKEMRKLGIIEKVTTHTEWCSAMSVVMKKDGTVRICIDPIDLKKAIMKPDFPMETMENIASRMPNAKHFTILDGVTAFWQIRVDEISSHILTFATPFGRYRYKRMPYGIPDASEVFQQRAKEFVEDLPGVEVMVDDFLIWGETRDQHDDRLKLFLAKARKNELKLSLCKAQFAVQEAKYCGHIVSAKGLKSDPAKIKAMINYKTPQDKQAVQRFLGMLAYLNRFVENGSSLTAPLRKLLENNVDFFWTDEQEQAFHRIKEALTCAPVLAYFDPRKETKMSVDASSHGVGAVIMQGGNPIGYASRALTSTQKKYAQIEKELLAVLFGCQRFEKYLFGTTVEIETDHKPLEYIFRRPLSDAPARLQRMLLALQRFRLTVKYIPGSKLAAADALSRAHLDDQEELNEEFQITMVTSTSPERWKEFISETLKDTALVQLKQTVMEGWPSNKKDTLDLARPYWDIKHELTVTDEVLFRTDRIIVPKSMRPDMLALIHEGHLGMELCKRRARETLFWPGMNAEIEQIVAKCAACQRHRRANQRETLIPHEVPDAPFLKIATDFFQLGGHYHLLLVDYTTGFIDVHKTKSTSALEAIYCCKQTFKRFGIPETLMSDNMPFSSREFKEFARDWGITLITSSPEYPQSNGLAERSIQTIKKLFKACSETGQDHDLALLNLNNAPREHRPSPAQALMGRRQRTKIPITLGALMPLPPTNTAQIKKERQPIEKKRYDIKSKDLQPLLPGQLIRMRLKNSTWRDAVVVKQLEEPRSYLVKSEDTFYRRNRRHLAARYIQEQDEPYIENAELSDETLPSNQEEQLVTARTQEQICNNNNEKNLNNVPSARTCNRPHIRPAYLSDYVE